MVQTEKAQITSELQWDTIMQDLDLRDPSLLHRKYRKEAKSMVVDSQFDSIISRVFNCGQVVPPLQAPEPTSVK